MKISRTLINAELMKLGTPGVRGFYYAGNCIEFLLSLDEAAIYEMRVIKDVYPHALQCSCKKQEISRIERCIRHFINRSYEDRKSVFADIGFAEHPSNKEFLIGMTIFMRDKYCND